MTAETAPRRVLVLANETCSGTLLVSQLAIAHAGAHEHVLVVAPALTSRLRFWVSDDDAAITAARQRLGRCIAQLRELGVDAEGWIGDSDPFVALRDGVRGFDPHAIVISSHPPHRSNRLERGLVSHAIATFPQPITHVVVDLEAHPVQVHRPRQTVTG